MHRIPEPPMMITANDSAEKERRLRVLFSEPPQSVEKLTGAHTEGEIKVLVELFQMRGTTRDHLKNNGVCAICCVPPYDFITFDQYCQGIYDRISANILHSRSIQQSVGLTDEITKP